MLENIEIQSADKPSMSWSMKQKDDSNRIEDALNILSYLVCYDEILVIDGKHFFGHFFGSR